MGLGAGTGSARAGTGAPNAAIEEVAWEPEATTVGAIGPWISNSFDPCQLCDQAPGSLGYGPGRLCSASAIAGRRGEGSGQFELDTVGVFEREHVNAERGKAGDLAVGDPVLLEQP